MLEIPLLTEPAQIFSVNINDITYEVRVIYNTRTGIFSADFVSDVEAIYGITLVGGIDLTRQWDVQLKNFYINNISGVTTDATISDLGMDNILTVLTDEEVEVDV